MEQFDKVIEGAEQLEKEGFQLNPQDILTDDPHHKFYLQRAKKHYEAITDSDKFQWRPYQFKYAALYALRRNNICALTMGLGKSIIFGLTISCLYDEKLLSLRSGAIQIVAPSYLSAESRWLTDLEKIPLLKNQISIIRNPKDIYKAETPIWIYTIDFPKRKRPKNESNRPYISRKLPKPTYLIVDEAHQLKPNTLRSQEISYLAKRSKRVSLLSGTISDGRLDLINFLCELTYGKNWPYDKKSFTREFSSSKKVKRSYTSGQETDERSKSITHLAPTKIAEYANLIQCFLHRASYTDPDISPYVHLPEREITTELVDPYPEHVGYYNSVLEEKRDSLRKIAKLRSSGNFAEALQLLHPLIHASNFPEGVRNRKLERLLEHVESLREEGRKVAIFTRNVGSGRLIAQHCSEKFRTIRIFAEDKKVTPSRQTPAQQDEKINDFLFSDIEVGVFSLNLAKVRLSIDLTAAGSVIFYDYPWAAKSLQQALFRVVRPGNLHETIKTIYLGNRGFIEQYQQSLLAEKLTSANLLLDFDVNALYSVQEERLDLSKIVQEVLT
jgi:superfamily II DNA or RNA helicase